MFLGITLGYASGIIFNYDTYLLGTLTQMAATIDVDPNYTYNNFSTLYIMLASMAVMVPILAKLIDVKIAPKFKKPLLEESDSNYSKKGFIFSTIALAIMTLIVVYLIVPGFLGSGILLDNNQTTYIAKLFTTGAPFKEGIMLIFLIMMMVCSFIYGKISKNIETSKGFTESLSKSLYNSGYLFALMFFASQMIAILDWTGLGELVTCKIVEVLSMFQFSGALLIFVFFILTKSGSPCQYTSAPGLDITTYSPTYKFDPPHTICTGSVSPISTIHILNESALGCSFTSNIFPTTMS